MATSAVLISLNLVAGACGLGQSDAGGGPAAGTARFTETDGWWSIEAPSAWRATRVELDGARTRLDRWQSSPASTLAPTRDPLSSSVYYEFQPQEPGGNCLECPAGSDGRIVVAARPLTDSSALANSLRNGLGQSPDVRDLEVASFGCGETECQVVRYSTPSLVVRSVIRSDPRQRRTYEVRASASHARWIDIGPVLERSIASFTPGSREA